MIDEGGRMMDKQIKDDKMKKDVMLFFIRDCYKSVGLFIIT